MWWELVVEERQTCGAVSPGGKMRCDYPPDHRLGSETAGHHLGRDSIGRWRSWPVTILDEVGSDELETR